VRAPEEAGGGRPEAPFPGPLSPASPSSGGEGAVPALELRGVVKRYGRFTAVAGIDLQVAPGEIFGFLGPNGAGKTTTIRMVAGVLRPTAGRIRVAGIDLGAAPGEAKRRLGYIPDRPFLYEKLSGGEFLRFVAALWGKDGPELEGRAERFLDLFSLGAWKDELIESYSHGMRQKLLIASALIHDPSLVVVDEPMVGLDPRAARLLKDLLRSFVDGGGSVFLSTHTLEVAEALCDRIAIMDRGRVIARGTMDELRAQADRGEARLEEIFLSVTGGEEAADLAAALDGLLPG
jgi:ABC-2 type transport system ATP-binding protein